MASLGQNFNENVERKVIEGGSPLPAGVYLLRVAKTKNTDIEKGSKMLSVEFDVLEPSQYSNRKVWDTFNYVNASAVAMRIAKEGIEDLRQACGIAELTDDLQLMDQVIAVELYVKKGKPYMKEGKEHEGKFENKIKKYWHPQADIQGAIDSRSKKGAAPTTPSASAAPATPGSAAPTWGQQAAVQQQAPQSNPNPAPQQTANNAGEKPWARHAPK